MKLAVGRGGHLLIRQSSGQFYALDKHFLAQPTAFLLTAFGCPASKRNFAFGITKAMKCIIRTLYLMLWRQLSWSHGFDLCLTCLTILHCLLCFTTQSILNYLCLVQQWLLYTSLKITECFCKAWLKGGQTCIHICTLQLYSFWSSNYTLWNKISFVFNLLEHGFEKWASLQISNNTRVFPLYCLTEF